MKSLLWGTLLAIFAEVGALAAPTPPPVPAISLSPSTLTIAAPQSGPAPAPSILTLQNAGDGKLNWSAVSSAPWLSVSPASGSLNKSESISLSVSVTLTGLAAGTLHGSIQVSAPGASNTPQSCAVTLTVSASPQLGLAPGSLSWTAPAGGPNPVNQSATVTNTGGGTLTWTASSDVPWLSGSPASGSLSAGASQTMSLAINTSGLPAGTLTGHWVVTSTEASNSPQSLPVSLTISPVPVIGLAPATLTFDAPQGGANPSPAGLTLSNEGGGTLSWTASTDASWLAVSPVSGSLAPNGSQGLSVSVTTSGLAEGTYLAAVHVAATGASNSPQAVGVTLNVNAHPKIGANPLSLSFTLASDEGASPPSGISITNTGSGTLSWTATSGVSWLGVSPGGGSLTALASQPLLLTAEAAGLSPGHYTTTVSVSDPNALNSPQTVAVDLTVTESSLPVNAPAGQCGLLGPELLAPALLASVLGRRRRKGGPSSP